MILSANGMLRDASAAIEDGRYREAEQSLSQLVAAWEAALPSRREPPIVIAAEAP